MMIQDQWIAIGAIALLVLAYGYGLWVGEYDKKEGKKVSHDFGM